VCAKNITEALQLAYEQLRRNPSNLKVLALVTPIPRRTEEEAVAKVKDYQQYASHEGALALFTGWVSTFESNINPLKKPLPSVACTCLKGLKALATLWIFIN
jgi:alkanesulfonate monooxygenase SsuD/methylene tetrahydromethanopterin reductase-like flavin-dependent oxidoreductase (luciferase family)